MFDRIGAVIFDLEDTLYTVDESPQGNTDLWTEIYERLIRQDHEKGSDAVRVSIQQSFYHNVVFELQQLWPENYEKEPEFVGLFTHALRAAGLAAAEDPHFVQRVIELHGTIRASRLIHLAPGATNTLSTLRVRGYKLGLYRTTATYPG